MIRCFSASLFKLSVEAVKRLYCGNILSNDPSHLIRTLDTQHDPLCTLLSEIEDYAIDRYRNFDNEWRKETLRHIMIGKNNIKKIQM
jgi:DUF438 domain-containing protein